MQTRVINIPYKIKLADSFLTRFKGLMLRKIPINNEGLLIVPCNAVHMFFMKFPIDVVLLNEQNEVVKVYHNLKPWSLTKPIKAAYSTLELPAGTIKSLEINIGSIVHFSNIYKN